MYVVLVVVVLVLVVVELVVVMTEVVVVVVVVSVWPWTKLGKRRLDSSKAKRRNRKAFMSISPMGGRGPYNFGVQRKSNMARKNPVS